MQPMTSIPRPLTIKEAWSKHSTTFEGTKGGEGAWQVRRSGTRRRTVHRHRVGSRRRTGRRRSGCGPDPRSRWQAPRCSVQERGGQPAFFSGGGGPAGTHPPTLLTLNETSHAAHAIAHRTTMPTPLMFSLLSEKKTGGYSRGGST